MNELMDVGNELMNKLGGDSMAALEDAARASTGTLIGLLIVGLLVCFFGLKLVKVLAAIQGFAVGCVIGGAVAAGFHMDGVTVAIVVLACGALIAALSFFLYRFGIFLLIFGNIFMISLSLILPQTTMMLAVCAAIAFVIGLLAAIFVEPIVILSTGISGGMSAGRAAAMLMGMSGNTWVVLIIGIVLSIIGISVQFMLHSKKSGKQEKMHSQKVKAQISRESDVDKARRILDDDGDDDDDIKFL